MDLLERFVCDGSVNDGLKEEAVDEEKAELSLGLSLNGRFGVEGRGLVTNGASSVVNEDETTLTRRCSLSEEWKKSKELQWLRRSEAKRKRVEKLKNGNCEMKKRKTINGNGPMVGSPASGGSSGVSDLETQAFSGLNKEIESKSRASEHQISTSNSIGSEKCCAQNENHWKMPCKGNGKKIQGFLLRYREGEQVKIVCVCHGSFLTPAEFVKHGGGGDVQHPLRHIVVNPPWL